ncbi:MAG: carboxylating nicotinate-nucleotide diphosphorylase [marine benthic group bacterium]|nr:carboxylating nicotinate-nucleotide diphosphorylase [Candidatus Benthicola marisminoris]
MRPEVAAAAELTRMALTEDVGEADWTSEWTVPEGRTGVARVLAKSPGIACGLHVAEHVFLEVDRELDVGVDGSDGRHLEPGDAVLRVEGSLRSILTAERTALNFLARLSGIATLTGRFVEAIAGTGCRVSDTRKTTPGWRWLEKYAVGIGGGMSHRAGLYDMVLIKENHIRAAGGVQRAIEAALPGARRLGIEVEVEVTNLDELEEALAAGPDRVMLDNMDPEGLAAGVVRVQGLPEPRPLVEASGGVSLETAREIALTGVDYISVGALTHSAPAMDYSLLVSGG